MIKTTCRHFSQPISCLQLTQMTTKHRQEWNQMVRSSPLPSSKHGLWGPHCLVISLRSWWHKEVRNRSSTDEKYSRSLFLLFHITSPSHSLFLSLSFFFTPSRIQCSILSGGEVEWSGGWVFEDPVKLNDSFLLFINTDISEFERNCFFFLFDFESDFEKC